jgi:hypothetical protein
MNSGANDYREMMERHALAMNNLNAAVAHQNQVIVQQGKVLAVNAVLIQELYEAIVLGDDLNLAVALLQDFCEPPPTGPNA